MRLFSIGLLGLWLAGCGGSGGTSDGGGSADASCGPAELRVLGELAGAAVDLQAVVAGQAVVNTAGDAACYANIYFEGGGRLRLEWPQPLPDGQTSQGVGSLNLEVQSGPNVGNCSGAGWPSEVTLEADGVRFVLRELARAPYCSGAAVAGELRGCATFKN